MPLIIVSAFLLIMFWLVTYWDKKARKEKVEREKRRYPSATSYRDHIMKKVK